LYTFFHWTLPTAKPPTPPTAAPVPHLPPMIAPTMQPPTAPTAVEPRARVLATLRAFCAH
jgi:hypothetical protein